MTLIEQLQKEYNAGMVSDIVLAKKYKLSLEQFRNAVEVPQTVKSARELVISKAPVVVIKPAPLNSYCKYCNKKIVRGPHCDEHKRKENRTAFKGDNTLSSVHITRQKPGNLSNYDNSRDRF